MRETVSNSKNLLSDEKIAPLSEWHCLCFSVFLGLNVTVKRVKMSIRNTLAAFKYFLNPCHVSGTVDTTTFRNILQQINE